MLDEVMAGLNPSEMQESIQLIQDVNATGVTFLFVEHVMKAVLQLCHRVMVINHGQLLAAGKPIDVLQQEEVIRAYIGGEKHAEH
jgi:ABC-type branched-subunit amino acid transport system ATPase component